LIIGGKYDQGLVKYVFLTIDVLALTALVLFAPPTPEVELPQFFMFKFDVFPFYFVLLGIAGCTNLTESMGPSKTVEILNAYFEQATEIIGRHNGVVTQFQGDAILAIFNVPVEDGAHADQTVSAARGLQDAVETETFAAEKLSICVGVNTGPMVAGNLGGGGRQSYTVHGNAVILAARLEALNEDFWPRPVTRQPLRTICWKKPAPPRSVG